MLLQVTPINLGSRPRRKEMEMSELAIRPLKQEDLDWITPIENRLAGHPRREFLEKRFSVMAADPAHFISCSALSYGNSAGYAFARIQAGEFGGSDTVAVLDVIGVDPYAQGLGIGKALMRELETQLKARNIGVLKTQVEWPNRKMVGFFSTTGFRLAACQIIERDTSALEEKQAEPVQDRRVKGDGANDLSRDRVKVRSLEEADLAEVVRIDRDLTGRDRSAFYAAKFREMLTESGIRVSLVAEDAGVLMGFVMARVDFGEFGKVDKAAVIDAIGVHPAFAGAGIGQALLSQLLLNLASLQVESVRTQVSPADFEVNRFLHACGFRQAQRLVLTKSIPLPRL